MMLSNMSIGYRPVYGPGGPAGKGNRRPLPRWAWAVTFGGAVAAVAVGWAIVKIRARTRRQT
jgi:hypothetical protein